ncbi:MAG: pyridoxamine 5'-phosphate oxidase family protein [Curvibacter lanceolatus]|jgi:predicted pyridoxine 5'-phosphate oxidase superfamily flavin-nucleotide-binding protein|uniref:pyridoxamine 5'-phosphate oxidase family protein n=1 Tax=Curvibacter lanceolatus TaxID=86182 RepID=UPI0003635B32|nr:pyridoxamine 5'-phosphate oxidase family protein [Curvibacter lanceolatus]MBV5291677.1 pyridoxamine 5'-phosphate oxidase family protein [Curvibacter lanceolatus]
MTAARPPGPLEAFHEGEQALQHQVSPMLRERMAEAGGRVLRDHMPEQHQQFFAQQPFVVTGTVAEDGQPWASLRVGGAGFMQVPDPRHLRLRWQGNGLPGDPTSDHWQAGRPVGLLGIEPATRRRNRLNGRITARDDDSALIEVGQSFGNCPKYIVARELLPRPSGGIAAVLPQPIERHSALSLEAQALVAQADTFFVATAHPHSATSSDPRQGVDVSHRGGPPGFVRVDHPGQLSVPDFSGNFYFNTLGNLLLEPRAGLLFIDFERGDLLYVLAQAQLLTDAAALHGFAGAQRVLRLHLSQVLHLRGAWPWHWGPPQASPHVQGLGPWRS